MVAYRAKLCIEGGYVCSLPSIRRLTIQGVPDGGNNNNNDDPEAPEPIGLGADLPFL